MAVEVRNGTLVAENVEVDMETLRLARAIAKEHPLVRHQAQACVVDALVSALDSEDRRRLEEYERQENPCEGD